MKYLPTLGLGLLFSASVFAECQLSEVNDVMQLTGYDQSNSANAPQVICKTWPGSGDIIVVAISQPDQQEFVSVDSYNDSNAARYHNLHIVMFNRNSYQIISQFKQPQAYSTNKNDQVSISLDLTPYYIQQGKRSFGLKINRIEQRNYFRYQQVILDLYEPSGAYLQPVIQGLVVSQSISIPRLSCDGAFARIERRLSVQPSEVYAKYADILVIQRLISGRQISSKQRCVDKIQNEVERDYWLYYKWGQYIIPDKLQFQNEKLYTWVNFYLR